MSTPASGTPAPGTPSSGTPSSGTPGSAASDAAIASQIRQVGTAMLWGGLVPALVAGVLTVIVVVVLAGTVGLAPALLGVVLVLVVCSLGPLVMRWTAAVEPMVVMGIAMVSFVTKFGLLAVLFLVLEALQVVDTRLLALSIGVTAVAFIVGETVAFARSRTPTIAL